MPCLVVLGALVFPRIVIVILWMNGYMGRAYESSLVPLIGFLFMPFTTLAYAWAMNSAGGVKGPFWIIVMVVAVIMDLGSNGAAERQRRRK